MKGKSLIILILICGIFAYIGLKPSDSKRGKSVLENTTPYENVDLNGITEVSLTKGKESLSFKKKGEQWRATSSSNLDFPLNFNKFRDLLLAVRDMKLESRITRSKSHDSKFGLNEAATPTQLTLKVGEKNVATLLLGKNKEGKAQAPNPAMPFNMPGPAAGQYLHYDNGDAVYLAPKPFDASLTPSNWIIEEIATAKKDEMTSISMVYPHKSIQLDKTVSQIQQSTDGSKPPKEVTNWKATGDLPSNHTLDSTKINDLLDDLSEIKVNEPVHNSISKSFGKGNYSLKVSRGENSIYEVKANKVGDDWYMYNTKNQNEIYKVSSFRVEDIFAKNDQLFKLDNIKISDNTSEITLKDIDFQYNFVKTGAQWNLKGKAPLPSLNTDKFDEFLEAIEKGVKAQDYLVKNIPPVTGKELILKAGNKVTRVSDLGDFPIKTGKLIQIGNQKSVYSLSKSNHDLLFAKFSDLVDLKAPSAKSDDLKTIKYSDFKLKKGESSWQFANGDAVNEDSVSGLWTSYEAIFDSVYQANGSLGIVKNSLKLTHSDDYVETIHIGEAKKGYVIIKSSRFGGTFRVNLDVTRSLFNGRMAFAKAVDKKDSESN